MSALAASARMYAVAPAAGSAWRALLGEVGRRAGVALAVVEHAYPAPLPALWSRPDLGCAFMCGWPLALERRARAAASLAQRPVIAAPVPDAAWSDGQPIYRSDFLVAAGSTATRLEEVAAGRYALNAEHSHSGANMPRAHLARLGGAHPNGAGLGGPGFGAIVGPLVTPRRCIEAVASGAADVTAVDSYALLLLLRHDPALAGSVRVLCSTAPGPIPPLVGSAALGEDQRLALRGALLGLQGDASGRLLLTAVCLLGFVATEPEACEATLLVPQARDRDRDLVSGGRPHGSERGR